ncbi:hypothetical protein AAY473_011984 [Plecturocebus cupreus]
MALKKQGPTTGAEWSRPSAKRQQMILPAQPPEQLGLQCLPQMHTAAFAHSIDSTQATVARRDRRAQLSSKCRGAKTGTSSRTAAAAPSFVGGAGEVLGSNLE